MREGRKEEEAVKSISMFEVPPPGYTGSLKGTGWDPDAMLDGYTNNQTISQ